LNILFSVGGRGTVTTRPSCIWSLVCPLIADLDTGKWKKPIPDTQWILARQNKCPAHDVNMCLITAFKGMCKLPQIIWYI